MSDFKSDGVAGHEVFAGFQHLVEDVVLQQHEVLALVHEAIDAVVVNGVQGVAVFVQQALDFVDGGVGDQLLEGGQLVGGALFRGQRNAVKVWRMDDGILLLLVHEVVEQ